MAHSLPRILAVVLVATYAAAAALPCGGDIAAVVASAQPAHGGEHASHTAPAAAGPGVAAGHGHAAGHGEHTAHPSAPAEAPVAEWTAPCPCGCDDGPGGATANSSRIGWALAQLRPALVGSSLSTALAPPSPGAPLDAVIGRDPVPI